MNQIDIIIRAQNGDEEAFEELYNFCYAPVFRFVLTRMKSPDEAEDITQDVFIKLFETLPRYRQQNASLLPYLFVIARNKIIDHYRKRRPDYNDDELWKLASVDPTPEEVAIIGDDVAQTISFLNMLGEADAEIVRMKYLDGFSTREIANVVGKREDAVRQTLSRSIRFIRSNYTSSGSH